MFCCLNLILFPTQYSYLNRNGTMSSSGRSFCSSTCKQIQLRVCRPSFVLNFEFRKCWNFCDKLSHSTSCQARYHYHLEVQSVRHIWSWSCWSHWTLLTWLTHIQLHFLCQRGNTNEIYPFTNILLLIFRANIWVIFALTVYKNENN